MNAADYIKQAASQAGFDACGIARAESLTLDAQFLQQWLSEGKHGDMSYLERNFGKRVDPRILVPGCKSVVVLLHNYYPEVQQPSEAPQIGYYAYSATDYHTVIKAKLSRLEQLICNKYGPDSVSNTDQHSFVDSAPILERRWAEKAGLGWIGKHTQLISPQLGSFCFIAVLLINFETSYDSPIRPRCGSCTRCMDACPTQAIAHGTMDARRCISYLTIESKKPVPTEFEEKLAGCALGCDICAKVCPWNKKWAHPHSHPELRPYTGQDGRTIADWSSNQWEALSEESFRTVFKHSALKRAGYHKLKENIRLAQLSIHRETTSRT